MMTDHAAIPATRIAALDILRGVAVMGILAMNIVGFAMPEQAYLNPRAYGGATGIDLWVWFGDFVLVDGKMRGLFSFLFGASLLLVVIRAEDKGESAAATHYSRMGWLAVFGLIHLFAVWWGDILLHYASIGMIAFAFRHTSVQRLGLWVAIFMAVSWLMLGSGAAGYLVTAAQAAAPGADPAILAQWAGMSAEFRPPDAAALAADLAIHRGPYLPLALHRIETHAGSILALFLFVGPETLAYMLLGMIGLRTGFLTGAWSPARYRQVAAAAILIGGAGTAALGLWLMRSGFAPEVLFAASIAGTAVFRPFMIVGYAALIVLATRHGGALVERIAAAGRAAFSNYLGTSLVMTSLFYGYGAGLYGHLGRAQLWLVVLAMWVLMLLWSKPWLERYRYGPLEWLWRTLARRSLQPMRVPRAA